jgi:hypothetical protein
MTKQMTHFRNGQGKEGSGIPSRIKSRRGLSGKRRGSQGDGLGTDAGQEGMRQHHQRDMTIPCDEAAHLVVIQAQIFSRFKIFLDMPARPDSGHHLLQGGSRRSKDEVVGLLLRIGGTPTHEQPMASIIFPAMQYGDARPVKEPGSFAALTHRQALPVRVRQQQGRHVADLHPSHAAIGNDQDDRFITGYGSHVGILMVFQPGSQFQVTAIDRVGDDPADLNLRLMEPLKHLDGQVGFGAEANGVRNPGLAATRLIVEPVLWEVEFSIDEGMAGGSDVGEKHAHLAVLHLASGAAVLLFDARRVLSAFGNYVSSKITTLDQQEDLVETDPLADCLPRFSVTNLHTFREQKFATGLHKEPVVLPISFNPSTHPFTVEPDLQGAS